MDKLARILKDAQSTTKKKRDTALELLIELTSLPHTENRLALRDLGAVPVLIDAISPPKKNASSAAVDQESALLAYRALVNISVPVENHVCLVRDFEIVSVLVGDLRQRLQAKVDEHVVQCVKCFVNLSLEPTNRGLMCQSGVCNLLSRVIRTDQTGEAKMWAVWTFTNLCASEECVNSVVNSGAIESMRSVMDEGLSDDPRALGVMAFRNLAKHPPAALPLVHSGVVEVALRLIRYGSFSIAEGSGNSVESCALMLISRLCEQEEVRKDLLAKGVVQTLLPVLARDSFAAMQAYMAVMFLVKKHDEQISRSVLNISPGVLQRLTELIRATLDRRGVPGVYDYGMFRLSTVCHAFLCASGVVANRATIAGAGCPADLLRVAREQGNDFAAVEYALEALLELSSEPSVKNFLKEDVGVMELLTTTRDSHPSNKARALAENLVFVIEAIFGPKMLFFSCSADKTTAIVCKVSRVAKDHPEMSVIGQPLPCVVEFVRRVDLQDELLNHVVSTVLLARPTRVVVGLTSWFQKLDTGTRDVTLGLLELIKARCTNVKFHILELSLTEEAMCEAKATNYAARASGLPKPTVQIGTLGGCFQMVTGGKFYVMPEPTFEQGERFLVEHGFFDGIEALEQRWDASINRFNSKNPGFNPEAGVAVAVGACCYGAVSVGLKLRTALRVSDAISALSRALDSAEQAHSTDPAVTAAEAKVVANLIGQRSVLETLVHHDTVIYFADEWNVNGERFRTDWVAGWFLQALAAQAKSTTSTNASNPTQSIATNNNSTNANASEDESMLCAICLENRKDALLSPCGHMCCTGCANLLMSSHKPCHICRTDIATVVKAFI